MHKIKIAAIWIAAAVLYMPGLSWAEKADEYLATAKDDIKFHHFDEAVKYLQKAVNADPRSEDAYLMLSICSADLGRYDDAIMYTKEALKINPQDPQVQLNMGYYYFALKQWQDSIVSFKSAIKTLPRSSLYRAYKGLGNSYMSMKEDKDALEAYKKAAGLQSNDVQLLFSISRSLVDAGKYQESLNYIEEALKVEPENPLYWEYKGGSLFLLKRFDEAKESLNKALDIYQQSGNTQGAEQSKKVLMAIDRMQQH